jgi:hypothetical protein
VVPPAWCGRWKRYKVTGLLERLCSILADLSVSDVKWPYLRVSESFLARVSQTHTLRTSSQIMIGDRLTDLMCCWHLHRGKRRELEYGTVPPGWLTVFAGVFGRGRRCNWVMYDVAGARWWSGGPQQGWTSDWTAPAAKNPCLPAKRAQPGSTGVFIGLAQKLSISLCLVVSQ